MYFKRKAYLELLEWKENEAQCSAALLEGARRVGKSTIARQFGENEYTSYILIDFGNASPALLACFDEIYNLDAFFLRLQVITGVNLIEQESLIIFDEIQLFPKARQAIKYLVQDGRYHYIETGSLISIKKNVKDILIPSEEIKIAVNPLDLEEFSWAIKSNFFELAQQVFEAKQKIGQVINRKWMRDFRLYMAIGGMPQAVSAYIDGKNFSEIDSIKRSIIQLYEDDFKKIDPSGRISAMYNSIPAQLARDPKKFLISTATDKRKTEKDESLLYDLIDSKTVIIAYNTTDPKISLLQTKSLDSYKMYIADIGLFVTLMFIDRPFTENEVYAKLLSDKLPANLGYLYENAVAQMIKAKNRGLYYHTWEKPNSTHYYEIDFLIANKTKLTAIEVKSSGTGKHQSLKEFGKKYSGYVDRTVLLSQKERSKSDGIDFIPIYLTPFLID